MTTTPKWPLLLQRNTPWFPGPKKRRHLLYQPRSLRSFTLGWQERVWTIIERAPTAIPHCGTDKISSSTEARTQTIPHFAKQEKTVRTAHTHLKVHSTRWIWPLSNGIDFVVKTSNADEIVHSKEPLGFITQWKLDYHFAIISLTSRLFVSEKSYRKSVFGKLQMKSTQSNRPDAPTFLPHSDGSITLSYMPWLANCFFIPRQNHDRELLGVRKIMAAVYIPQHP